MKKYVVVGLCFLALVACKDETFHQLLDTTKFHESNQTTVFVGKWKQVLKTDDKGTWIAETSDKLYNSQILYDGQQVDSDGFTGCGRQAKFEISGRIYTVEPQEYVAVNPSCQNIRFIVPEVTISLLSKDTLITTAVYPNRTVTTQTKCIRVN